MNLTDSSGRTGGDLFCFNSTVTEICSYKIGSQVITGINAVTMLVNILHIIVLFSIKKLRSTKYFWTLMNIGSSDIFASVMLIVQMDCSLKHFALKQGPAGSKVFLLLVSIPTFISVTIRNSVLALASYERYVAICTPFRYATNKLVQHLAVGYTIIWSVSFVLSVIIKALYFEQICVDDFGLTLSNKSPIATAIKLPLFGVPAVITIGTLAKVGVELKQMSRRAAQPVEDEALMKAGKYVLLTSILFYLSFFPPLVAMGARGLGKLPEEKAGLIDISAFIVQGLYGTLNVILFIYLNPSYIQQVIRLLKCKLNHPVAPQVDHNQLHVRN